MELKLEDYARREGRMWYEIMLDYADRVQGENGPRMFIRPSSGYLKIWHFILNEDETDKTYIGIEQTKSLRGTVCFADGLWRDWATNDPPWYVPANPANGPKEDLLLVPSFVYLEYNPKDETEYYRFGMPEPMTIHLTNIWIREKKIESASPTNPKGKRCILWMAKSDNLEQLANLLTEFEYIDSPSVWSAHFSTDSLKLTTAPPIKWKKNKYELQYLLKNLQKFKIFELYFYHFEGLKTPPWSGNKPTEKLDTIKAILKKIN